MRATNFEPFFFRGLGHRAQFVLEADLERGVFNEGSGEVTVEILLPVKAGGGRTQRAE
jgi:hypothetical protein